jgi:non-ribosomal peptide synthetase component F
MSATDRTQRIQNLSPEQRSRLLQALRQRTPQPTTTIPRRTQFSPAPLSLAQRRLWFLDQLAPGNPAYNISAAIALQGQLNITVLEQSLQAVVQRHETLRTTFQVIEGEPVQVISPNLPIPISAIDLQQVTESDRSTVMQQNAIAEAQFSDLATGPLLRVTLLQFSSTEFVALLTMHHIISDGWSIGVLIREVAALYAAFYQGDAAPLAVLPVQYADFASWQQQYLQAETFDQQLTYWQQQLAPAASLPALPTDYSRPAVPCFRGAQRSLLLSPALTTDLKTLSQQLDATLFMTLLAAFQTLLYCYTQQEILIGTPIANRNPVELEELIGFFVNTLVLRTQVQGDLTFEEVVQRSRQTALEAFAHPDVPFEKLVEVLQPERQSGHNPLFQVWFAFHNTPLPRLQLPDLQVSPLAVETGLTRHDLSLHLWESPEGLRGIWEYRTNLFASATIESLIQHFETCLQTVVAQPKTRVEQLVEMFVMTKTQQQHQQEQALKTSNLNKLKQLRRKAIDVSL